jgi:imidazolonepropionase-like amidohydrolase
MTVAIGAVALLVAASVSVAQVASPLRTPSESVETIHAARVIDGRGTLTNDAWVDVRGGRIVRVYKNQNPQPRATYELGDATLLPGMIDAHVHFASYVTERGLSHQSNDGDTPEQSTLARAGNLHATLLAGFTTIQSVGSQVDLDLRNAVARWQIVGPRILTAVEPIRNSALSPDSLRGFVRGLKARGADVVKVFASEGPLSAGVQTFSQEQLAAICSEAKTQGLRTLIHAVPPPAVHAAVLAGCTQVEHGTYATGAELRLMAEHGTILDPQVCLVLQTYLDHREALKQTGMSDSSFIEFAKSLPVASATFAEALRVPGLRIVFGTDVGGFGTGHNAEEFLCRVKAGQRPMDAITSATSVAAEAMGLGDRLGFVGPGYEADLIAVRGNPARDISALQHVVFVMRGGIAVR